MAGALVLWRPCLTGAVEGAAGLPRQPPGSHRENLRKVLELTILL